MTLWFAAAALTAALSAPPAALDTAAKARVIDGVLEKLAAIYVYPEKVAPMAKAIRARAAAGEYARITDGAALADALTAHLRAVVDDRHLRVAYSPEPQAPREAWDQEPTDAEKQQMRRVFSRQGFGLGKAEVLDGNVGYIDVRLLLDPADSGPAWTAALNFVADTDALILDLRRCPGALSDKIVPFVCGHFFEKPVHLTDIYWRPTDATRSYWSAASVPGRRYLDRPIYLLTARGTFSGAEELAYDLKNLKRATLVGETTGGGAHGGGDITVDAHFTVWIPAGRNINPVTKTDWEGVGVSPDIAVPARQALAVAHRDALRRSLAALKGDPEWRDSLTRSLAALDADLAAQAKALAEAPEVTFRLKGFGDAREVSVAGSFNDWGRAPMVRKGDAWVTNLKVPAGRQTYKFVVDGRWLLDPANATVERDPVGYENSVRVVRPTSPR